MEQRKFPRVLVGVALVAVCAVVLWRTGWLSQWTGSGHAADTIVVSGNIEAHTSTLGFKGVQSRLVELPVDEGQSVKAGTVLAVLDNRDLTQQVAVAQANVTTQQRQADAATQNAEAARKTVVADQATLALRERDLQRTQDLKAQGFVSDAALDTARTAVAQARAVLERDQALMVAAHRAVGVAQAAAASGGETLALSRIQQGYATLVAPFDGVVVSRQAERGEVVAPGTPVLTLADLDHVWLRAYLNEPDMGRVRLGQEVSVHTDAFPQKAFKGRIAFIASQAEFTPKSVETHAERVTLVYRIKIDLDNPEHWLLPGMPADATIQAQAAPR